MLATLDSRTADLASSGDFVAFCEAWECERVCPFPLADWLLDRDLPGHADGARWAAEWPDAEQGHPTPRFTEFGWRWREADVPAPVWAAMTTRQNWPTFAGAVASLFAAWAVAGLSFEQQQAARTLLAGRHGKRVQTCGGFAGTGKTRLLSHLAAELPRYAVCAYTGKAADVLKRLGLSAQTIHGTIYRPVERAGGKVEFARKVRSELGCDGFLVDEASMVGSAVLADLESYNLPVIAVGDHGQLPPVGEDAGLMRNPDVRLETVHRNAGPIARFAEHLRKGGDARDWGSGDGVYVVDPRRVDDGHLTRADQIISAYNRTRVAVNRRVRALHRRELFEDDRPAAGDRVMCMRNDRLLGVFNGQQGTAAEVDHAGNYMLFRPDHGDPVPVFYHPAGWNAEKGVKQEGFRVPGQDVPFDFAWCVTAHKAQGDEFGKVLVFEERCDRLWDHARWAYTAASRAKEKLLWVVG